MRMFSENRVFIIAEMANAHEGKIEIAKEITKKAAEAKADAIKFQRFTADELATKGHENYQLYKKLEMTDREWVNLVKFAKGLKLHVFVDVFGLKSARKSTKMGVDGFKIHSSDIGNPVLLDFFSKSNKALLISTGGTYPNEIDETVKSIRGVSKEIALMHGFQGYPTKISDMNFNRICLLKKKFGLPIGVMDHVDGDLPIAKVIPLIAVGVGARIIEKHITLERSMKGLDYFSSLNPDEFHTMVKFVREAEKSFGKHTFDLPNNEISYRHKHKKHLIAKKEIKKGTILKQELFEHRRSTAINSVTLYEIRGKKASMNISKGATIEKKMIDKKSHKIIAAIACRVNSSRLFAKQMQLIDKNPILYHVITQLKMAKMIDDIVLAISEDPGNEIFVEFAKKHDLKFILGSDSDVLKRLIAAANYVGGDMIFRVTPENPFLYWEGIDDLIKAHIKGKYDFSDCYSLPLGSGFEIVNVKAFERSHKDGSKKHRSELCSLYIKENQKKFKILHYTIPKIFQRPEIRLTVDTPEDLFVARQIFKSIGNKKTPIRLKKIIEFLDKNPQIAKLNSGVELGESRIWISNDPLNKNP
jgi:N,N'-diacetyllegionaminate synthase